MECTTEQKHAAAFKESGVKIRLMCILSVFDHAIFKKINDSSSKLGSAAGHLSTELEALT